MGSQEERVLRQTKPLPQSLFTGKIVEITTVSIAFYQSNLFLRKTVFLLQYNLVLQMYIIRTGSRVTVSIIFKTFPNFVTRC